MMDDHLYHESMEVVAAFKEDDDGFSTVIENNYIRPSIQTSSGYVEKYLQKSLNFPMGKKISFWKDDDDRDDKSNDHKETAKGKTTSKCEILPRLPIDAPLPSSTQKEETSPEYDYFKDDDESFKPPIPSVITTTIATPASNSLRFSRTSLSSSHSVCSSIRTTSSRNYDPTGGTLSPGEFLKLSREKLNPIPEPTFQKTNENAVKEIVAPMNSAMKCSTKKHDAPNKADWRKDDKSVTAMTTMSSTSTMSKLMLKLVNKETSNFDRTLLEERKRTSSASGDQDVEELVKELEKIKKRQRNLEKQLEQANIQPVSEEVSYEEVKAEVEHLTKKLLSGDHKNEEEQFDLEQKLEKSTQALELMDEWEAEQSEQAQKWEEENDKYNQIALSRVWSHLPLSFRRGSMESWKNTPTPSGHDSLPYNQIQRFHRTNVLPVLRQDPIHTISKWHPCNLEQLSVTGMSLTERRALYAHINPMAQKLWKNKNDVLTKRKWEWHDMMTMKLKESIAHYNSHAQEFIDVGGEKESVTGHYDSCPCKQLQCPIRANLKFNYFAKDYGFPSDLKDPTYEEPEKDTRGNVPDNVTHEVNLTLSNSPTKSVINQLEKRVIKSYILPTTEKRSEEIINEQEAELQDLQDKRECNAVESKKFSLKAQRRQLGTEESSIQHAIDHRQSLLSAIQNRATQAKTKSDRGDTNSREILSLAANQIDKEEITNDVSPLSNAENAPMEKESKKDGNQYGGQPLEEEKENVAYSRKNLLLAIQARQKEIRDRAHSKLP